MLDTIHASKFKTRFGNTLYLLLLQIRHKLTLHHITVLDRVLTEVMEV